jgi:nucleotide-binding universal stress UspA family protein
MSVAVAHQVSPTSHLAIREAAREALMRETKLEVLHVTESFDLDVEQAVRGGLSDEIEKVLKETGLHDLSWDLHLATGEDVADALLSLTAEVGAELLVIGARHRSPVGKFLLGSVTQTIILDADVPVLVVKLSA